MSRHGEETTDSEKIAAILVHITYLREEQASLKRVVMEHVMDEDSRLGKLERRVTWMLIGFLVTILAGVVSIPSVLR